MAKHAAPKPATPLEHKVTATTGAAAAIGIAVAVLNGLADTSVLDALHVPPVYQGIILAVIPPLLVLLAGFKAPHTERPDLDAGAAEPMTLAPPTVPADNTVSPQFKLPDPGTDPCGH